MILDRYIRREVVKPTVAICTVLVFIFGCYIAARYLEDAVNGQMPGGTVVLLILLRIAIALEVLLPMTLYLSVIIALGRLYGDSEMIAMVACGVPMARILRSILLLAVVAGGIVACFSLYIRPWSWERFYALKARALVNFDMTRMRGGNFYETENGDRVIFADQVDGQKNRARRVFIQTRRDREIQIIFAREARQQTDRKTGQPVLEFQDGFFYEFSRVKNQGRIMEFGTSMIHLETRRARRDFKVKAANTAGLARSDDLEEIAERQWRFAAPISTVLLALLGALLARSAPRQGKYAKMPAAVVVFAVYYNFSAIVKKWVGQGVIDPMPGMWWVQILMAGFLVVLLWWPRIAARRRG
jgi:lipopolysaccharide export system permease protein